jgi:tripartite-type tricarboxylate transporter receptor subunit TctC
VRLALSLCLLLAATAVATAPPVAHAQSRPLRIIVPLPAGSTSDVVARMVGDGLKDSLARPVVVENRPGASGRIAVDALRNAAPDGTTLLFAPVAVPVIIPLVFANPGYDPQKDLVPVAQVSQYGFACGVAADHPARTLAEFVAWAKANPGHATYGTPGAGSLPHFIGVVLRQVAGIELVHVAYRSAALAETDMLGGRIAAVCSTASDFLPLHRAGKLRVLATAGAERSPLLPAVPTFREQGYPAIEVTGWHGVYAPAGTPAKVVDQYSTAIAAALRTPELAAKFAALGLEPTGTTPDALATIMADDIKRWRPIVKASGFTPE